MCGDNHFGRPLQQCHHAARGRLLIICQWVIRLAGLLYLLALALLLTGTFGLFGQERDPLSGVFLIPLGLPWVLWTGGFPEAWLPWSAALTPLLNLAILKSLCRYLQGSRTGKRKLKKGGSDAL